VPYSIYQRQPSIQRSLVTMSAISSTQTCCHECGDATSHHERDEVTHCDKETNWHESPLQHPMRRTYCIDCMEKIRDTMVTSPELKAAIDMKIKGIGLQKPAIVQAPCPSPQLLPMTPPPASSSSPAFSLRALESSPTPQSRSQQSAWWRKESN
jgi:hypothetical protein